MWRYSKVNNFVPNSKISKRGFESSLKWYHDRYTNSPHDCTLLGDSFYDLVYILRHREKGWEAIKVRSRFILDESDAIFLKGCAWNTKDMRGLWIERDFISVWPISMLVKRALVYRPDCQLEIYTSWLSKAPVHLPDAWDDKHYFGTKQ